MYRFFSASATETVKQLFHLITNSTSCMPFLLTPFMVLDGEVKVIPDKLIAEAAPQVVL